VVETLCETFYASGVAIGGEMMVAQGQAQRQHAPKKLTAYLTRHIQALKTKIKRQRSEGPKEMRNKWTL